MRSDMARGISRMLAAAGARIGLSERRRPYAKHQHGE
jgi:hypothetical protein